ncbi:MAG: hypothetical protein HRT47_05655 [Candidatus Caenarcaniphilales bacterium]|nr:hypothetical protein [Candidatus Caenarcaniphilales bacterium]
MHFGLERIQLQFSRASLNQVQNLVPKSLINSAKEYSGQLIEDSQNYRTATLDVLSKLHGRETQSYKNEAKNVEKAITTEQQQPILTKFAKNIQTAFETLANNINSAVAEFTNDQKPFQEKVKNMSGIYNTNSNKLEQKNKSEPDLIQTIYTEASSAKSSAEKIKTEIKNLIANSKPEIEESSYPDHSVKGSIIYQDKQVNYAFELNGNKVSSAKIEFDVPAEMADNLDLARFMKELASEIDGQKDYRNLFASGNLLSDFHNPSRLETL